MVVLANVANWVLILLLVHIARTRLPWPRYGDFGVRNTTTSARLLGDGAGGNAINQRAHVDDSEACADESDDGNVEPPDGATSSMHPNGDAHDGRAAVQISSLHR